VGKLLFGGGWWWGRREGLFWLGFCFCGWQLHYYIAGHKNSFVGELFCLLGGKKQRKKERSLSIICQSSKVSFLFLVANELSVIQWFLGFVLSWWVDSFWGIALCGKALCVCVCVSLSLCASLIPKSLVTFVDQGQTTD
jgi:hypothetical protein